MKINQRKHPSGIGLLKRTNIYWCAWMTTKLNFIVPYNYKLTVLLISSSAIILNKNNGILLSLRKPFKSNPLTFFKSFVFSRRAARYFRSSEQPSLDSKWIVIKTAQLFWKKALMKNSAMSKPIVTSRPQPNLGDVWEQYGLWLTANLTVKAIIKFRIRCLCLLICLKNWNSLKTALRFISCKRASLKLLLNNSPQESLVPGKYKKILQIN